MTASNLALVSCRSPFLDDAKIYAPMANLYLKSYLEQHTPQHNVWLMDDAYNLEDLSNFEPYSHIGISIMTPQKAEASRLAKALKAQYPDKKIIAGGPHCKHYFTDIADLPEFDYVVRLNGEKSLVNILNGSTDRIHADVMSKKDVNEQPRPDRTSQNSVDILRQYHYKLRDRYGTEVESTTLMTGFGCPMQCTFCEDAMTNIKWSSLDSVIGQLDDITSLGYGGVYIFDDLFAIAMNKIRPICDEISKRDMIFRCNGQANYFTKWGMDFPNLLADSGCVEIAFGTESGSQKILDNIRKRTTVQQNYDSILAAKEVGIRVKSFILLGLPGEDWETLAATEQLLKDTRPDDIQFAIYYPYKGTQARAAMDAGEDIDLFMESEGSGAYGKKGGKTEANCRTKALSSKDLLDFRDYLVREYKPKSHAAFNEEKTADNFFDTHLAEEEKE